MTGTDLVNRGLTADLQVTNALRQLPTWATGVGIAGEALIAAPFKLYDEENDEERREIFPGDPKNTPQEEFLVRLFRKPNPAQHWAEFMEMLNQHHYSDKGTAFIRKVEGDTVTKVWKRLELIPPEYIDPIPNPEDLYSLAGWKLRNGNELKPEQVAMVKWNGDPSNPWKCIGPTVSGQTTLNMDLMSRDYTAGTLAGGGVPVGLATYSGDDWANADPKERDRLENELASQYGRPKGKRWLVVMGPWAVTNPGFKPSEMQNLELMRWIVEDTARIQKIPPLYLASFEGMSALNGGGLNVQEALLYKINTIPRIRRIQPVFQNEIIEPVAPNVVGEFDLTGIAALQQSELEKLDAATKMQALGVPFEQVNEHFELGISIEDIPWAAEWFIPAGMVPARDMVGEGFGEAAAVPTEITAIATGPTMAEVAEIVAKVEAGTLPRDAGLGLLEYAGMEAAQAAKVLGSAGLDPEPEAEPVPELPPVFEPEPQRALSLVRRAREIKSKIAQRQASRVAFVKAHTKIEREMARAVRAVRNQQRDAVLSALISTTERASSAAEPPLQLDNDQIDRILARIRSGVTVTAIGPAVTKAARTGAVLLFDVLEAMSVPHAKLLDFQRNRLPAIVDGYRDARMANPVINQVDDRLRARVNDAILASIDSGKGITETVDAVRDVFTDATMHRARTIARTETAIAMNGARAELMREQGVERVEWMTVGDDLVRDEHGDLDGEIVAIGERFSNGLEFPGDPSGDAASVVNCRCTLAPVSRSDFEAERSLWRPGFWDAVVREELAA